VSTGAARDERALRAAVVATAREMNARGINRGKSGNVSARLAHPGFDGYLITPTGLPYAETGAEDIVAMPLTGEEADAIGSRLPSSEWRFHRDIYGARPGIGAIVHTHAPFATTLACLDRGIPAFHYMIAIAGGSDIRCAPYATFGTQALSDHAVAALDGRRACLLAHHGMIATGPRSRRRSRSPSRSKHWPRCTGAHCRSASRHCSPTTKMAWCRKSSPATDAAAP
jgi:L-fuculose-phosphate aldolase